MTATQVSRSATIRGSLDHPVIDCDGHLVEFMPLMREYLREVGGSEMADRLDAANTEHRGGWSSLTEQERLDQRCLRPAWWSLPTKHTVDNATAMLPRLLRDRMEELGFDYAVLYPTRALNVGHLWEEDLRRAWTRACNLYLSDVFGAYPEVMTPAAVIPMYTPEEAIEELEFAVNTLGMKVAMLGLVRRPIPSVQERFPEASSFATYIDNLAIDSPYDYDPVWRACLDLKVVPTFHSGSTGWGSRTSPSNFTYNHIGHFAAASETLAKAFVMGGVTHRFPELRCAFLESGVGWAFSLLADLVGHWEKRNGGKVVENSDPANLDRDLLERLFREYADGRMLDMSDQLDDYYRRLAVPEPDRGRLDDFGPAGIERVEDIRDRFVPNFFFGCEADDPVNALAFDRKVTPFGARLQAIFSSDIGHWDVPDMREVLEEAYEMVEDELITEEDFRDFVFVNPVRLFTGSNPDFFKGTAIEDAVGAVTL